MLMRMILWCAKLCCKLFFLLLPKHPKSLESVQRCLDIQARGARAGRPQRVEEVPGEPEKGGVEGEEDQRGEGQDLPRGLG